jgi:hypothetical protein
MQFPTVPDEWEPLAPSQFIDAASSTALTVPALPAGHIAKGAIYVGIMTAQNVRQYLRYDGNAVTAAVTGGEILEPGDWVELYGIQALKAVRVIRSGAGGTLAVKYYYFRKTPS